MSGGLLEQAFVYLTAAMIVVPVARRLGLGSVLGYLIGGVLIGPSLLGLVGEEGESVMHFAEFGVVMMLFLVGLELEPARLWRLRTPILGLGGSQVLVTAAALGAGAIALGLPWQQGVAVGLILAMSSTAIGLQSLTEKGLLRSDAGQKSFSVLLFQDIAVIPILAVFPLLATVHVDGHGDGGHGGTPIDALPAWAQGLVTLGAIVAVIAAGRYLVRPAFRIVADTGLREMFTGASLLLVVGVTLLMSLVGLSPALGAFLAGVVLANSEYRHELETDLEPFKGLLLGLFFMAVGSSLDLGLVLEAPGLHAALLLGVLAVKLVVLIGLARAFGTLGDQVVWFALSLGQVGEFAFVLLSFAARSGVLSPEVERPLVAVTALSMAASPLMMVIGERLVLPRLGRGVPNAERASDVVDEHAPVIIAGFGRFGQICGRMLRSSGIAATVMDIDGEQLDILRRFGQQVYYGDASRVDLLRAAGAEHAKVLIVAVDRHEKVMEIVHATRKHFPNLAILARARGRTEAYELIEAGVDGFYRETFDTSLRVGEDAMRLLGIPAHQASRASRMFRRYDERATRELAPLRGDQPQLVLSAREKVQELEKALKADQGGTLLGPTVAGWDDEALREWVRSLPS